MTFTESRIYNDYINFIKENMDLCKRKSDSIRETIIRSNLFYDGEIKSKSLMIPKVYSKETFKTLENIMSITHEIVKKVTKEYLENPDYRAIFPFPKVLEELILCERGYDTLIPISRYDIFYNEKTGDFKFCEFNTDGTSGMDENRVHDMSYTDNAAHQFIRTKYNIRPFELFDSLCEEFLKVYKTYDRAQEVPRIVITDFGDAGRFTEFKEFARHFQAMGAKCYVCDIRDLKYDGSQLYTDEGYPVDAVYRRSCTNDIIDRIDEVEPFINCVKDGNVFLCGAFATQLTHSKWIFNALYHDKTKDILTDEENEFIEKHVPKTLLFTEEEQRLDVIKNKDSYILKPIDGYASHGVYAGVEFDNDKWEELVNEAFQNGYICQEYAPQFRTLNIDFAYGDGEWKEYLNMTGLYCFNGKLAGFFNRQSDGGIIRTYSNERTVPSYIILED